MNLTATALPRTRPASDLLATPWASTTLPQPVQPAVSFAGVPTVGPGRAPVAQQLVRPWDGVHLAVTATAPVSFATLAAPCRPVLPSQRQPVAPIAE